MLHRDEDEADSCSQQEVHGLVQQFGGKDAPYKEMIAQDSYQNNVGCSWHGPQQGQTVAAVAHCNRAPVERKRIRETREEEEAVRRTGQVTLERHRKV